MDTIPSKVFQKEDGIRRSLQWAPMLGHLAIMFVLLLIGMELARHTGPASLIGVSLCITVASLSVGGSLGFLFGIPRVNSAVEAARSAAVAATASILTQASADARDQAESSSAHRLRQHRLLSTNTNLEKVSDWLTTMLVGVGLTQLGNVNSALLDFREFLASYAIVHPDARPPLRAGMLPVIGPLLLIGGLMLGFVYFYVFTRVVIAPKFSEVESALETNGSVVSKSSSVATLKEIAQALPLNTVATQNVVTSSRPTVEDSLSVMFEALYQPGGYENALRIAEALRGTEAIRRPDYWLYVAAAHGQQYKAAKAAADADAMARARADAMRAAHRAVELNASYRIRLWLISNPDELDNDLSDFRDDPEFRAIVGQDRTHETA